MIAPPDLLARATMCKQFSDTHTSTFTQAVAAQYLQTGRLQATLNRVRRVYAERACAMAEALTQHIGDGLTFSQPQGGLFFWPNSQEYAGKAATATNWPNAPLNTVWRLFLVSPSLQASLTTMPYA
jgi:2-aminoadipate transaminase